MSSSHADRVVVPGSARVAPSAGSSPTPCELSARTTVTILVRPRASPAAVADRLAATAPADRVYLTRAAFADAYGADPADVAAVQRFAIDAGLVVLETSFARRSIVVEGTLHDLGAAFGASLQMYEVDGTSFRARTGELTVPASVASVIVGVFGLDERPQARAQFRPAASPAVSYSPVQIATAYGFPTDTTGVGQTVGIIELGGGYAEADLTAFFSGLGIAVPSVTSVSVDGATNAPTGDANSADGEVELDVEVVGAVAPGAKIVVYFAPNTDQGFLDAITTAIHDQTNAPNVISISWGGPESTWTTQATTNFDAAFADAGTLGITVTVASGDNGSTDGVTDGANHVDFPASSPNALACGGTTLRLSGAAISTEKVWNDGTSGGASGGGVSDVFDLPAYQSDAGVPVVDDAGGKPGRGVPDVSGDADPETGYAIVVDGSPIVIGGTSAVAPLWAGLVALLNARAGKPAGFLNPTLYANPKALRDVVSGNNGAFAAKAGWDACTGLGTPDGPALAALFPGA